MKRRIIITAGHQGPGTGANSDFLNEGSEAIILRDMIAHRIREHGLTVFTDPNTLNLRGVIAWLRSKFTGKDIIIEIHFNAGPPKVGGTECFVQNNYSDEEYNLASLLCKSVVASTKGGIINRGVKTAKHSQHSRLGILEDTPTVSVLWEVSFLSNKNEVELYQAFKIKIAQHVAELLTLIVK